MQTTDNPADSATAAADPEWVAELLDTMTQGDMDVTAEALEGLAHTLRKASKARHALAQVPAASIRAASELRAGRNEATACR